MKNIKDYMIHESSETTVDNIIIGGSGSMYYGGKDIALILKKNFKNAKLFQYDTNEDKVIPLKDINDFKPSGPHSDDLSGIVEFYKKHNGEMTIFMQN